MTSPVGASAPHRLPSRARDRRPALAALALLLVLLGALGSALLVYRSGDRVDVLVAAREILPGEQVSEGDFGVARVAYEGGSAVDAGAVGQFVGAYSTSRIPEGTIVSNQMFSVDDFVPTGGQLVGLTIAEAYRPSQPVQAGDVVRLYAVPTEGTASEATPLVDAARVIEVAETQLSEGLHLTVLLPDAQVAAAVALNAYGQVALTKLPDTATPAVDNRDPQG